MQPPGFLKNLLSFLPSHAPLGLDLGFYSIKLVQVKKKGTGKDRLLSYAIAAVKPDSNREGYIDAIKQGLAQLKPDSRKVNISVSGPNVIVRYIILPVMQEQDLKKSLDFELERYIPFKRQTAVIDYRIVATLSNNQMVVLIIAVEERFVEEKVKIIRAAGLEPQSVNIDAFALMETFNASESGAKGVSAVLDIGYHSSKLVVFESDKPYFSRDIEVGEREIFQLLAEKLALDQAAARELCYDADEQKIKEVSEAVSAPLSSLLSELSLSFEYCERDLEKKVQQLYVTGGGSKIKSLLDMIKSMPELKLSIWNPVQDFTVMPAQGASGSADEQLLLGVGTGLALS